METSEVFGTDHLNEFFFFPRQGTGRSTKATPGLSDGTATRNLRSGWRGSSSE